MRQALAETVRYLLDYSLESEDNADNEGLDCDILEVVSRLENVGDHTTFHDDSIRYGGCEDAIEPGQSHRQWLSSTVALKSLRLDIPYRTARVVLREQRTNRWKAALTDIQRLLVSKNTKFVAGPNSLQARRTRAVETHL